MLLKIRNKIARKYYRAFYKYRIVLGQYQGLKLLLCPANHLDRLLKRQVAFEKEQLKFVLSRIADKQIDCFVDIGANLGLYSLTLAKHAPSLKKVVAFEAQVENFNQLCGNIFLNQLDRKIEPHNVGVSDQRGTVTFLRNVGNSTGTSRILETAPEATKFHRFQEELLRVDTLDTLLSGVADRKLLLKIDVEGHEMRVLAGARETLRNNHCTLQIELLSDQDSRITEICEHYTLNHFQQIGHDHYFESRA